MIEVFAPHDNIEERSYIIQVVFEFLNLEVSLSFHEKSCYEIRLPNKTSITINDHFFSQYKSDLSYLSKEAIPNAIQFVKNEFAVEEDLPLIFGADSFSNKNGHMECGFDIFSSAFFCLTRWEEYVQEDRRDLHQRFPAEESLLFKQNCLHRPIVNEYVEFLWNMINHLDQTISRNKNKPEINFTHDIDLIKKPVGIKKFARDILIRRSIKSVLIRIGYLFTSNNPYNMFNYFMDKSEQYGAVSRFYFMTGHNVRGKDGEEYLSNKYFYQAIDDIKRRKHVIGIHPSYNSYDDFNMVKAEKESLEKIIAQPITEGRQHVLRFHVPNTWQIWADNGLTMDSTLGYSAQPGFRCGTGNKYPVFNFLTRKKLKLNELPLIVMDTTLQFNQKLSIDKAENVILTYLAIGKKYNMPITLLFHNCFWDEIEWKGWSNLYESIFKS